MNILEARCIKSGELGNVYYLLIDDHYYEFYKAGAAFPRPSRFSSGHSTIRSYDFVQIEEALEAIHTMYGRWPEIKQ